MSPWDVPVTLGAVQAPRALRAGRGHPHGPPWLLAGFMATVTALLVPFASVPVGPSPAFLPAYLTLVLACNLLTGVLLAAQYRDGGDPRLLVLSWAYLWSAATIVPHALTFAGVVTEAGLLGAVPSSAQWLWVSWHVGFPVLLGIGLMPWPGAWRRRLGERSGRTRRVVLSGVVILCGAWGIAALVTVGGELVPVIITDGDYTALTVRFGPALVLAVLAAAGAGLTGILRRRRAGVEVWAFVALVAAFGDLVITLLAHDRFSVGWYGARSLALIAAAAVLTAMLKEITALHRQVRRSAQLLEQQNLDLTETQALRDHLVAVVSHDLRTPVAGLTGYLELLGDGGLSTHQTDRMLGNSRRLTRHLTLLIEDLLAVATLTNGYLDVRPERIDVRRALEEAADGFPEVDVCVDCRTPTDLWVDPLRLQQVLANLIGNARKYGAEPVWLSARTDEDESEPTVLLEVRDAGAGVPPEFVEHLFEPYSRAEGVDVQGSGLGLSVVRDLVEAHRGTVAYDIARNAFVLRLPVGPPAPSHSPREAGGRDVALGPV